MAEDIKSAIDEGVAQNKAATDRAARVAKDATDTMQAGAEQARNAFSEKVLDPAKRAGEAMKESGGKIAEGGATIGKTMIDRPSRMRARRSRRCARRPVRRT